jgi:cold shock protein
MPTGSAKWYNASLGYGFLHPDDGEGLSVHHSAVIGASPLEEGERLRFTVVEGPRGAMAWDGLL